MRRFSKRRASEGVSRMPPASAQPVPAAEASADSGGVKRTCLGLGRAAEGCQEAATLGDSGRAAGPAGPTERSCAVHTEGFSSAATPPNRPQPNNNIILSLRARETDPRGGLGQVSDSPVPRTLSVGGAHLILQALQDWA
jgi:hypothetical protein